MKDVDDMLSQHTPKPTRALKSNFTETIMTELKQHPRRSFASRFSARLRARHVSPVAFGVVGSFLLVGGAAAAIALWPQVSVTPTVHQELPSGNHIVGYDTQNCNYFDQLKGDPIKATHNQVYYEIRAGAKLTDQQWQDALQGICEENMSNAQISEIMKDFSAKPGTLSTNAYTIDAITPTSLTISPDSHYDSSVSSTKPHQTYTNFASSLVVYNQSNKAQYSDLHVGDSIKLIIQDTSPQHGAQANGPSDYNTMNHPENVKVLAIDKIPALTGSPDVFYLAVGTDVVRLDKCSTSSTGFCRAYNFVSDSQQ